MDIQLKKINEEQIQCSFFGGHGIKAIVVYSPDTPLMEVMKRIENLEKSTITYNGDGYSIGNPI